MLYHHLKALSWFQRFISLQWFILDSTLSSTSMIGFTSMLDFSFTLPFTSTPRSHRVWPCFLKSGSFNLTSMLHIGFNAFLHFKALSWFQRFPSLQCLTSVACFSSLRRSGHIECDQVFLNLSPSISLQCFIWVSRLSFTSKLYLGFNPFLHFNALLHFNVWLQCQASLHLDVEVTMEECLW